MSLYSNTPDPKDALEFLKTIPLFAGLSTDELMEIIPQITRRSYAEGITLFHQGMPGSTLFVVEKGTVRVFGLGLSGQEHTLNTFGPGKLFGEMSVLDNEFRSATAVTMTPVTLWLISKDILDWMIQTYPYVARKIIELLTRRLRAAARHIQVLIFQDVLGRVAFELLHLSERHGRPAQSGLEINIPLTQAELSTMVGTTRESINKSLTLLRKRNYIEVKDSRITVLEPQALGRLIEERGR